MKDPTIVTLVVSSIEQRPETWCPKCRRLWEYGNDKQVVYYSPLRNQAQRTLEISCDACYEPQTHPL